MRGLASPQSEQPPFRASRSAKQPSRRFAAPERSEQFRYLAVLATTPSRRRDIAPGRESVSGMKPVPATVVSVLHGIETRTDRRAGSEP